MLQFALVIQYRSSVFIHNKYAESLQCLILRCGRKGKIAGIIQQLTPFHHSVDFVLVVHLIIRGKPGEGKIHLRRVASALPGMRLINDNSETILFVSGSNLRNNVWEFLNRGNNDALAVCDGFGKIAGVFCPGHSIADLHKLLDGIPDLFIEDTAVSDYNDRVQHRTPILFKSN